MFERAVCHRYCFYYTLCQVLTAGYGRRWRVDAAAISIIEIIMLTSLLSGGRAERRGWRSAAWTGRCRSLCVIGIMGWFSGGNDAFDGVRDETGAKFTEPLVSVFVCFKIHIYVSFTAILNTSRSAGFGFYDSKNVLLFKLYLRKVCKRPNDWSVTGIQTSQTDALLLCSVFAHFENQIRLSVADSGLILVRDRTGRQIQEWRNSLPLFYQVFRDHSNQETEKWTIDIKPINTKGFKGAFTESLTNLWIRPFALLAAGLLETLSLSDCCSLSVCEHDYSKSFGQVCMGMTLKGITLSWSGFISRNFSKGRSWILTVAFCHPCYS